MKGDKSRSTPARSGLDALGLGEEDNLPTNEGLQAPAESTPIPLDRDLSHAFRTQLAILTLISGNLDILYERLDDEKRRQMIRDIRRHTRTLNDLAADMLSRFCTSQI